MNSAELISNFNYITLYEGISIQNAEKAQYSLAPSQKVCFAVFFGVVEVETCIFLLQNGFF